MNKALLFSGILLSAMFSCSRLNGEELRLYVENPENGLIKEAVTNRVSYRLKYRPNSLVYLYEARENATPSGLKAFLDANANSSLFILDIVFNEATKNTINDFSPVKLSYQNELNANYIELQENDKKFPCRIYHCETTNKGHYTITLTFDKNAKQITDDWRIKYFDVVTGDNPEFIFKKEDIDNIPTLKL